MRSITGNHPATTRGALLASVVVLALGVGLAAPAGAPRFSGATCTTQTGTASVTPGLGTTAKAQTIVATTTLTHCSTDVVSGTGKATIKTAPASCAHPFAKGPITETINWHTKVSSTLTGTATTGTTVGQATITLKVTKGLFLGQSASTVISLTPAKGSLCSDKARLKKLTIKGIKPFNISIVRPPPSANG